MGSSVRGLRSTGFRFHGLLFGVDGICGRPTGLLRLLQKPFSQRRQVGLAVVYE